MNDIEVIAHHGWGFDASCWQTWEELVPEHICWKNFDRGYFNDPKSPDFSDKGEMKIIIVHSYGFHQCSNELLKQADVLVVFAGFLIFHPKAVQFKRRSQKVLTEMISQYKQHPEKVLKTFYRNTFHPQKSYDLPRDDRNDTLLLEDLKKLDSAERTVPVLKKSAEVLIFHGAEDAIIPKRKGRALFEKFGDRARYFEIKKAGHALPITHARKCWQMIDPEVVKLT